MEIKHQLIIRYSKEL